MKKFNEVYNKLMKENNGSSNNIENIYKQILALGIVKPGKNTWDEPVSIENQGTFDDIPNLVDELAKSLNLKTSDIYQIFGEYTDIFGDEKFGEDLEINSIDLLIYIIENQLNLSPNTPSKELVNAAEEMDYYTTVIDYNKIIFMYTESSNFVNIFGSKEILTKLLNLIPDGLVFENLFEK